MKTLLTILLLATLTSFADEGGISPTRDRRGFIGGTFTGNASGLTNYGVSLIVAAGSDQQLSSLNGSILTNLTVVRNSGFNVSASGGTVTNVYAGWYRLVARCNLTPPADNSDVWGLAPYTNTYRLNTQIIDNRQAIQGDLIAELSGLSAGQMTLNLNTDVYLPAGTRIDLRLISSTTVSNAINSGEFLLNKL